MSPLEKMAGIFYSKIFALKYKHVPLKPFYLGKNDIYMTKSKPELQLVCLDSSQCILIVSLATV